MKNPADENAVSVPLIKDNVLAHLEAAKTWTESLVGSPDAWLLRNQVKPFQQKSKVSFSLLHPPGIC